MMCERRSRDFLREAGGLHSGHVGSQHDLKNFFHPDEEFFVFRAISSHTKFHGNRWRLEGRDERGTGPIALISCVPSVSSYPAARTSCPGIKEENPFISACPLRHSFERGAERRKKLKRDKRSFVSIPWKGIWFRLDRD